jgi:uracil DNA glycosylase
MTTKKEQTTPDTNDPSKTTAEEPKLAEPTPDDPLALAELFSSGGEPWMPILKPVIEAQWNGDTFIGPKRDKHIVPLRELTFQALKPNPPEKWNVVVFGQNPYPRIESATGIAMFDNSFNEWKDSRFGRVTSIRCILKAACIWKHGVPFKTPVAEIRKLLATNDVVMPPEWFQAMLTQGVLLLNAALTASSDDAMSTSQHTAFWRPVVEKLIEAIFEAKSQTKDPKHKGVVFAWWGTHARGLRSIVEKFRKKYPSVPVQHVDHYNPAAQGDAFCKGNHFADINGSLESLGMDGIDWLPSKGWDKHLAKAEDEETAKQMGDFITKTMELHQFYLDRLQGVKDEKLEALPPIEGVMGTPIMDFVEAMAPVVKLFKGLDYYVKASMSFAEKNLAKNAASGLTRDEVAALYIYTTESVLYRRLNATLRDANRAKILPYYAYLRLFFSALSKLPANEASLYRGVALDLRSQYPKDQMVTWWGVSSCTSKIGVARGFLGSRGKRMLFEVVPKTAVSIRSQSAFTGEDEYILAPGTQLKVVKVTTEAGGLCVVRLEELPEGRMVS